MTALDHLFRRHGLFLNDIERIPTHGGSIRQYVVRTRGRARLREADPGRGERAAASTATTSTTRSASASSASASELLELLHDLKTQGKRVAAYGASAKGSTMLSYLNAGPELIEFVVDRNVHKQGKFMPGVHNPIYGPDRDRREASPTTWCCWCGT